MAEPAQPFAAPVIPYGARAGDRPAAGLPLLFATPSLLASGGFADRLGAAWRDTALGAMFAAPSGSVTVDPGFDAVVAARQVEDPEDQVWLMQARNRQEFDAMLGFAAMRRRDRALAAQEPLMHGFFVGALDPTTYVAVGSPWVRAGAGGLSRMARGGLVQGVTVGAEETMRAALDPTVPLDEVAASTVGATVMGAMIGRVLRPTSPAAVGLGRYLNADEVRAGELAAGRGAPWLRSEEVAPPPETPAPPPLRARPVVFEIPVEDEFASVGAAGTPRAAAGQSGDFQPVATGTGIERLGMSPLVRLLTSPIDAVGEAIQTLAQTPFFSRRNERGVANPGNVMSDQYRWQSRLAHALQDFEDAYLEQRGVGRLRAAAQDLTGRRPAGMLSEAEFSDRVWQRLHATTDDVDPRVNRAAASLRAVYDEMGDEAAKAGFFDQSTVRMPKRWQTLFGDIEEGYVNRVWNKAAIEADRAGFETAIKDWLARTGRDIGRAKEIVEGILTDRPFRGVDDSHVGQATSSYRRKFDAPSVPFQRWVVTDPRELLSHYVRTMGPDIALGLRAGGVDARGLVDNVTKAWFEQIGRQTGRDGQSIFQRLQGDLDRLRKETAKEYASLEQAAAQAGTEPRLEDIAAIRDRGMRRKETILDMARDDLGARAGAHGKLWEQMQGNLDDLHAVRDIIRGTYGQWDDSMAIMPRVLAAARKVAMMTSLTGVVSQLSDVGALALKEGFTRTFGAAFAGLRSGMATVRMGAEEARLAGTALEMMNASRAMALGDLAPDISGRHSMVERMLDRATQASFHLNLMNPWSSFMKGWAGLVIGHRIAEDLATVAAGVPRMPVARQLGQLLADQETTFQAIGGRSSAAGPPTGPALQALQSQQARIAADIDKLGAVSAHERLLARIERARLLNEPTAALEAQARRAESEAVGAAGDAARMRLARAGIDEARAPAIAAQLHHHGSTAEGVTIANTRAWTDGAAREAFRRALAEDIDNAVISADGPGRSLWLSKPLGQTLGMFHAYGQATLSKLIVPALQQKDARLLAGVAMMVGAGAISDDLRRRATGDQRELSAGEATWRAIDRSGVTGWFGQLFQAASNLADTRFGPAFAGAPMEPPGNMPVSRGNAPDGMIRALGPVASNAHSLIDLGFRSATLDWGKESARDMRRLLPLNNVTHLHFAFSSAERALAGSGRGESPARRRPHMGEQP